MSRYLSSAVAIAFGALGAIGLAVPAGAGVIFDNGAPLPAAGAPFSDFSFPQQMADDFTLGAGANTVTDVHWWGVYSGRITPIAPDDFTIRFFADESGVPAATPAHEFAVGDVGRIAMGDTFEFWTTIPATTFVAGTPFWLSVVNDTPGTNDWAWLSSVTNDGSAFRVNDGDAWLQSTWELAFQLTDDAVPEPATLALFAAGLLALGFLRRRRHAAHAV